MKIFTIVHIIYSLDHKLKHISTKDRTGYKNIDKCGCQSHMLHEISYNKIILLIQV